MNVLLTCAGRRNYLIQFFREALGGEGEVFVADASMYAPALREADEAFVLPRLDDPDYLDRLLAICQERRVDLLISLNDYELPLLARRRDCFRAIGTLPVISSPAVIETCYDKWRSFLFLEANGIPTARTYCSLDTALDALATGDIAFPLVVKPRWGSGSCGIEQVRDTEELNLVYALATKRHAHFLPVEMCAADQAILIQEWLDGEEYGLDVINDLDGRYAGTLARRKLLMRAGETDRAPCGVGAAGRAAERRTRPHRQSRLRSLRLRRDVRGAGDEPALRRWLPLRACGGGEPPGGADRLGARRNA